MDEGQLDETVLGRLSALADKFQELELAVFTADNALTDAKKKLEYTSRVEIPTLLNEYGLTDIRLKNGKKIEIRDKVRPNLKKDDTLAAFNRMLELEETEEAREAVASLFTSKIVVNDVDDAVQAVLLANSIPFDVDRSIHYQTLGKYCRERLESGKRIPEQVSVFQYQETQIK